MNRKVTSSIPIRGMWYFFIIGILTVFFIHFISLLLWGGGQTKKLVYDENVESLKGGRQHIKNIEIL